MESLASRTSSTALQLRFTQMTTNTNPLRPSILQRMLKVIDRFLDSLLEFDARLPTKHLFRARDIRLSHLGIIDWQWFVFDCRFRAGDANDFLGELFNRHLARVANVHRLMKTAHRQSENAIDQIGHVTK